MKKNVIYIFSNGRVAAIDKKKGEIIWEVKLKQYTKSALRMYYGQISVEDDKIFVGVSGLLFCLNAKDGSLLWKNELKGWGYAFVSLAGDGGESSRAAQQAAANAAAVMAASSTATGA